MFPALKIRNLGGQIFKDDPEMETVVIMWLMTLKTG